MLVLLIARYVSNLINEHYYNYYYYYYNSLLVTIFLTILFIHLLIKWHK